MMIHLFSSTAPTAHGSKHFAVAAAALLVMLGTLACGTTASPETDSDVGAKAEATREVGQENVAFVERGHVNAGPTLAGTLEAEKTATVRAQLAASVLSVAVDVGQRVAAGALLAQLDDRSLREAVVAARSQLRSAESTAENAQRELARQEQLLAIEAVAVKAVESGRQTHATALATVSDMRSRLISAEQQLSHARILAPFAGVISERVVAAGDVVQTGGAMFTILDPGTMRLEGSVPAESLASVKVGAEVVFSVRGYPDKSFTGRITRISPSADSATRQVMVFASLPNPSASLVTGLFANGRVTTSSAEGLTIPTAALDAREQVPIVVRVRNQIVERVPVTVGLRDELAQRVLVSGDLAEGDILLTGAAQQVPAGTRVNVVVGRRSEPDEDSSATDRAPRNTEK